MATQKRAGRRDLLRTAAFGTAAGLAVLPRTAQAAVTGNAVVDEPNTFSAPQTFAPTAAHHIPVTIQAAPGQTSDLIRSVHADGTTAFKVTGDGSRLYLRHISTEGQKAPEIIWCAKEGLGHDNAAWGAGVDVAADIPSRDWALWKAYDGNVNDFLYCSHNGPTTDPTLGIGKPRPGPAFRTWIVGSSRFPDPTRGVLRLQAGEGSSGVAGAGPVLECTDWGGRWHVQVDPSPSAQNWKLRVKGQKAVSAPVVVVEDFSDSTPQVELLSNGRIRFGGSDTQMIMPSAAVKGLELRSNVHVANFLSIGRGAGTAPPLAMLDIAASAGVHASFKLRTAASGGVELRSRHDVPETEFWTSNRSGLLIGTNKTPRIRITADGAIGFFGAPAVPQQPVGQPATDPESAVALVNALRTALINLGLGVAA